MWPPLNLAYLGAWAEQSGHAVQIVDGEAEGLSLDAAARQVLAYRPDLVGITATTPFYHLAIDAARALKLARFQGPIAIGGPHITVMGQAAFEDCFDLAFIGAADRSWPACLAVLAGGGDPRKVRGLLVRCSGKVVDTGPAEPIADVDAIPIPARHLLKNELYRIGTRRGLKPFTTIMTTRGCPFHCIFCSTRVFGKDTRRRSPALVIQEMEQACRLFGAGHFMFLDDTLTLNREHVLEICDRLIAARLGVTFEGSTRANLVDEVLVSRMVAAGLIRLSFGLESVDETIRATMRKQVPLASYAAANRLTNRHGIETLNSCMIGLPGETVDTIRATLAFLRRSRDIKQANISIAVPYPGTELFEMAKRDAHGLHLETLDFSRYLRYDTAVMTVGDLSPADLVRIQNEAFASIYLAPWRWPTLVRKWGLKGAWLTFKRLLRALRQGRTRFLTDRQLGLGRRNPSAHLASVI